MTKVETHYELTQAIDESLMRRISEAPSLFGLTRIRLAQSMKELIVDYDATRLTAAQVDAALHRAGIPAVRR